LYYKFVFQPSYVDLTYVATLLRKTTLKIFRRNNNKLRYIYVFCLQRASFFAPRGDYTSPHFATRGFKNILLLTLISASHVLPPFTRAIS